MNWLLGTTIALGLILLMLFGNGTSDQPVTLPPLDEDQVQVHWIKAGEPAPFEGLLINEYTYKRIRLVLLERSP